MLEVLKRSGEPLEPVSAAPAARHLCVAFSGGLDSSVLLAVLGDPVARVGRSRAVHVDHQLHPARQLGGALRATARGSRRALHQCTVTVAVGTGEGLEAAARRPLRAPSARFAPARCW